MDGGTRNSLRHNRARATYLVVEPGRGADGEEELAAVGVGPRVGHRQRVRTVVPQTRVKLVLELTAPDRLPAGADPRRVASLQVNEESFSKCVLP